MAWRTFSWLCKLAVSALMPGGRYGLAGIFLAMQTETLAALRLSDRVPLGLAVTIAGVLTRIGLLAAAC